MQAVGSKGGAGDDDFTAPSRSTLDVILDAAVLQLYPQHITRLYSVSVEKGVRDKSLVEYFERLGNDNLS